MEQDMNPGKRKRTEDVPKEVTKKQWTREEYNFMELLIEKSATDCGSVQWVHVSQTLNAVFQNDRSVTTCKRKHAHLQQSNFRKTKDSSTQTTATDVHVVHNDVSDEVLSRTSAKKKVESRKQQVTFSSIENKKKFSHVVIALSKGSVRKAVRLLLNEDDVEVKRGIKDVVNKECKVLLENKKVFRVEDPNQFENPGLQLMKNEIKLRAPVFWTFITAVANNSETPKCIFAASVLLNARNITINKMQHIISVCMYNNHLQKEGFDILSQLGATVSHRQLNRTLKSMESIVVNHMKDIKEKFEKCIDDPSIQSHSHEDHENVQTKDQSHVDHLYAKEEIKHQSHPDHLYAKTQTTDQNVYNQGYRLVIDNLDCHIKVRNMTKDHQNEVRHYVQVMAVLDRINCEHLDNTLPLGDLREMPNRDFFRLWRIFAL